MKLSQTEDSMQVKVGGAGQLIGGLSLAVVGIVLAVVLFGGFVTGENGQKPPAYAGFSGILFVVIGFFVARAAQNRTVMIRKGGDTTVTASRLMGGNKARQSFPTATITGVRLSTYLDNTADGTDGNRSRSRRSELRLLLKDNDTVQIASDSHNGNFSFNGLDVSSLVQKAPLGKEADQLAKFLGVPLDAQDNTNLATAVHSVVDAFKKPRQGAPEPTSPKPPAAQPPTPQ